MREIFVNARHLCNGTVRADCLAFWISEGTTKRLPLITSRTSHDALWQAVEMAAKEAGPGLIVVCLKPLVNPKTQEKLAPYNCRVTWKSKFEFLLAARLAQSKKAKEQE